MSILTRMIGAARLDSHTYEEVESDSSAMPQALLVVVIVAIFSAAGGILGGDGNIVNGIIFGVVRGVGIWAIWALVAWMIGVSILRTPQTHADWGQVARGTAFAQTPGLFNILAFVPSVGGIVLTIVFFWQLVGMVISIRQTLDYTSSLRAFFVVLLSAIPAGILTIFLALTLSIAEGDVTPS